MSRYINRIFLCLCVLSVVASAGHARADEFYYNYNPNLGGHSPAAGYVNSLSTSFNTVTNRLKFQVNISPSPSSGKLPTGLYLALDNGPDPKGLGHLAMLYFDAIDTQNPKLTAYAYNTDWNVTSWLKGTLTAGTLPDKINSSIISSSWINTISVLENFNGSRTFTFDIDSSLIRSHAPLYPGNSNYSWYGIGFEHRLGMWFGTFTDLLTTYHTGLPSDPPWTSAGYLTDFKYTDRGWIDISNQITTDCAGNPRSDGGENPLPGLVFDQCGVCGGSNACLDCTGTPNGTATVDLCGVCGGNNTSCLDCSGTMNGGATVDACGVCGGNGSTCVGCDGVVNSGKVVDQCGVCGGINECTPDITKCNQQDISQTIFAVDVNAGVLNQTVRSTGNLLIRLGGRQFAVQVKSARTKAKAAYTAAWTSTWIYGTVVTTCSENAHCAIMSFAGNAITIDENLRILEKINRSLSSKIAKIKSSKAKQKAKQASTKGIALLKEALVLLGTLPASTSICK